MEDRKGEKHSKSPFRSCFLLFVGGTVAGWWIRGTPITGTSLRSPSGLGTHARRFRRHLGVTNRAYPVDKERS